MKGSVLNGYLEAARVKTLEKFAEEKEGSSNPDGVIISRAERLRIPRELDSGRIAKLRAFRTRISEWVTPSREIVEEPIIVAIREKRKRLVDEREVEWYDEIVFDHFHANVVRFEDLIAHKKAAGYKVTVLDAVLAYLLVFQWGRKSVITGFLRTFPEWRDVSVDTVGEALSRLLKKKVISIVRRPRE